MLHVLIGNQQDLDVVVQAIGQDGVTPWVVPKGAMPGDRVLIFFRHMNAIFGSGEVLTDPAPTVFGNRHVHRAGIGIGHLIDPPLSLDELSDLLPNWAWVRYPRTYTTPADEISEKLWEVASARFVGEFQEHEELSESEKYVEGSVKQILVNQYERDPLARAKCLEHHGSQCIICGFDFGEHYGGSVEGFIHVHHIRPLADIGKEYQVNPITDLIPVCPNCHAVIHSKKVALLPNEVKDLLAESIKKI